MRQSTRFCTLFLILCATAVLLLAIQATGDNWASPGGKGSYALVKPADGTKPDGGPVRMTLPAVGPNVDASAGDRKAPTSDWWTPLVWLDPGDLPDPAPKPPMAALSWQIFSEPLVFQPQKGGLALSLNVPDTQRAGMRDGVLTGGAGFMQEVVGTGDNAGISPYFNAFFDQDLYLGSTASGWNEASFSSLKVTGWSDWFVNFTMESPTEKLAVTAGNGSPFVLLKLSSGAPQVTFRTWNIGTVIPESGDAFGVNAGMADGQAIPCSAFAVVNQVPFGAPASPSGAQGYSAYTVYGVFGPAGSTWTLAKIQKDDGRVLNTAVCSGGSHYAVAVLPLPMGKTLFDQPDEAAIRTALATFARYAFAEVTDTRVEPRLSENSVTAVYTYQTTPVAGESPATDGTLHALYPHQYLGQEQVSLLNSSMSPVPASSWAQGCYWPSLKGPMMLGSGSSFLNTLDVPPCLPALIDDPDTAKADRMAGYLQQALDTQDPNFLSQGSYFGAQEIHRLAMLLPIAEMVRSKASDPAAVDRVTRALYKRAAETLAYRLQAVKSDGSTLKNAAEHALYYDPRWGTLIPSNEDGFAADSLLNDHHYHYGYYIKIATEIARWEKAHPDDPDNQHWAEDYAPMIRLLIRDIANTSRAGSGADPDFPFLRHFSPYAGHSWASGSSRGNQGGQQESTPEAIQAWGALLLWAQLNYPEHPDNMDLERWAAYQFASEAKAAELYWFGHTSDAAFRPYLSFRQYAASSTLVPQRYVPSMVSQVNQNEMTFQTDFGNPPLLKHGIQWLPLTGTSLYLGTDAAGIEENVRGYLENDLPLLGGGRNPASPSNKDKLLMAEALTSAYRADPQSLIAAASGDAPSLDGWKMQWEVPAPTYDNLILQDTSRGAIYWWIDSLLSHGTADHGDNGASHTCASSFRDASGNRIYTAHNPGTATLQVRFDDGKVLTVPPLGYAHEGEGETPTSGGGGCSAGTGATPLGVLALLLLFRSRLRK